ncbi:putative serine protease PepD [Bifidobacterium bohemicum]|uniref:Peptidase S1 and S6, chymotrypsin/Hap n=1 Tax=Bifidobacterium bohemicum DSM 22767 TaxID=1437606 RepID=A0A086ZHH0_9BIFI|nr:trypsin-like peptidase domain-containing protein [Bifidobacterium bohemicum]KFI45970.1 peptidase S1 and S6, chymotrypsin/Hap [Bifidobacterium bohemicum DSM 22767]SCC13800.1 putative serine protease PepD [Bifidobacterium bohemicum]
MAEDNKDEWGSSQRPRPNEDTQTTSSNVRDDASGQIPTEVIPNGVNATQDTGTAPTETFHTTYRPDGASSRPTRDSEQADADAGTEPSASATAQYRPAPEYGAYGTVPTQNAAGANPQYGQTPKDQGNPSNPGDDFAKGMPWNGIFRGFEGNRGSSESRNGSPQANPYYAQGQFNGAGAGANGGGFYGPNVPQDPNVPQGPNGAPGAARQSGMTSSNVITAVVAALVAAFLCLGLGWAGISNGWIKVPSSGSMSGISSNKSGSGSASVKGGQAPDWQSVAQNVQGSVVSIQSTVSQGVAKGSGAVLDDKGHVVTNNHVISGSTDITVTLSNGQMYKADVVGADPSTDLAVIKLQNPPSDLRPVAFADSDKLAVGENVMAVGNPLGYDDTATTGIVSALERPVSVMDDNQQSEIVTNAVQIDAAINPGNSGGPTFNAAGQVIGINSSIASASSSGGQSGSIGIGFAIPSNLVKRISNEILENGSVKHAVLGVAIKSATVEADGITRGGAQVTTPSNGGAAVSPGSPAAKAGIKANDTIVAFDGNAVGSNSALLGYVRAASLGDKAKLTVVRDGKTIEVDVTLDQQESKVSGSNRSETPKQNGNKGKSNNGNGSGSDGSDGNGGGGLFDPFGLW